MNETELSEIISQHHADKSPLHLFSGQSKTALLPPVEQPISPLDLSGFSGIKEHQPSELIITVGTATPMNAIINILDKEGQMLGFEPPNYHKHLHCKPNESTIGGVMMSNLSGSRRFSAGGPRDHFLAFRGVNGQGQFIKHGAPVVKNVTGFDLVKLMAGSFGTLLALSEITLRLLPKPSASHSLIISTPSFYIASQLMQKAMMQAQMVSGAAYIPANISPNISSKTAPFDKNQGFIALRIEGNEAPVKARLQDLCDGLRQFALDEGLEQDISAWDRLETKDSRLLWQDITNLQLIQPLTHDDQDNQDDISSAKCIWRVLLPPKSAPIFLNEMLTEDDDYMMDWAGGLIWFKGDFTPQRANKLITFARQEKGDAQLYFAPDEWRKTYSSMRLLPEQLRLLSVKLKHAFDPNGILNPHYSPHKDG